MSPGLIIFLVILGLLVLAAIIQLFTFKDGITKRQENIKRLKSDVRVVKAKYIQTLRKVKEKEENSVDSVKKLDNVTRPNNGIYASLGNMSDKFGYGFNLNEFHEKEYKQIEYMSSALMNAQNKLNAVINEYNVYISRLFRLPYSKLFKCKKIEYIDEGQLDKSVSLEDIDGYGI